MNIFTIRIQNFLLIIIFEGAWSPLYLKSSFRGFLVFYFISIWDFAFVDGKSGWKVSFACSLLVEKECHLRIQWFHVEVSENQRLQQYCLPLLKMKIKSLTRFKIESYQPVMSGVGQYLRFGNLIIMSVTLQFTAIHSIFDFWHEDRTWFTWCIVEKNFNPRAEWLRFSDCVAIELRKFFCSCYRKKNLRKFHFRNKVDVDKLLLIAHRKHGFYEILSVAVTKYLIIFGKHKYLLFKIAADTYCCHQYILIIQGDTMDELLQKVM